MGKFTLLNDRMMLAVWIAISMSMNADCTCLGPVIDVRVSSPSTFILSNLPGVTAADRLVVWVKGTINVNFGLASTADPQSANVLIILGAFDNNWIYIRNCTSGYNGCTDLNSVNAKCFDSTKFVPFWIRWTRYGVWLGRGTTAGVNEVARYQASGTNTLIDVSAVLIGAWDTPFQAQFEDDSYCPTTLATETTTQGETTTELITTLATETTTQGETTTELITTLATETTTQGETTTELITTLATETTTQGETTTELITTLATETTTQSETTTELITTLATETSTQGETTTELITTLATETSTQGETTTELITTLATETTTQGDTTTELITTLATETSTQGEATTELITTLATETSTQGEAITELKTKETNNTRGIMTSLEPKTTTGIMTTEAPQTKRNVTIVEKLNTSTENPETISKVITRYETKTTSDVSIANRPKPTTDIAINEENENIPELINTPEISTERNVKVVSETLIEIISKVFGKPASETTSRITHAQGQSTSQFVPTNSPTKSASDSAEYDSITARTTSTFTEPSRESKTDNILPATSFSVSSPDTETPKSNVGPRKAWQCKCLQTRFTATNVSSSSLQQEMLSMELAIREELTIPKDNISASLRKKTCATDERYSSMALGSVAGIFCFLPLVAIFLMDLMHIIHKLFRAIQNFRRT